MLPHRHARAAALVGWLVSTAAVVGIAATRGPAAAPDATIAMVIAPAQFRDEELLIPKQIFEQAKCRVRIFSTTTNVVTGMLGARVRPEALLRDLDVRAYDAVVFVGGSGAQQYWNDARCHAICRAAVTRRKALGALCIAPAILARAGVLTNLPATVFPSAKQELLAGKARYTATPVVTAGRIVTADGPASAAAFARALLRVVRPATATP